MNDRPKEAENGSETETSPQPGRLTPGMKRLLWVVGGVVAVILVAAVWLATAGGGTTEPTPTAAPTRGPLPGATPTTGSEVQDPEPGQPEPGRIPPLAAATPLVSPPLPESTSANRKLVKGFPSEVMGPAPDSDIVSSSIATEGNAMQVTLVARTDASADAVIAHYRAAWAQLGLMDRGANSDSAASYADSLSSLTLAFSAESGTGTLYTVFGSFRTE